MTHRQGATIVLVVALAMLAGSIAWVVDAEHGGWSHHGRFSYGPAMMGLGYRSASATPVTGIADARQRAQAFADRIGLKTDEVIRFQRNYYVKLVDKQGNGATEVLVDPATGATSLEYGPAMMWNTKYGMISGRFGSGMMRSGAIRSMMGSYGNGYGGMMGGYGGMMAGSGVPGGPFGGSASTIHPSAAQATATVSTWLAANQPGTAVKGAEAFPGYFTFETTRRGTIVGMVSVNASTGAVWPHWWHGALVESAG